ncbi:type VI secretion system protein TssR domain-containing protein [uncultured Bacteroides sp.]|uniref:type VI secretion system protein TssR domain-containing protein n=1 Tax=uncultured Bacteroides sp. TaxID=162156 RepID=UPI0025DAD247|nr:type VI secretion system protein TssR domain-containing protein [uncultured Bacteroides sp.]
MRKLFAIMISVVVLSACAPVHRFTQLRKLPREYSDNYSIEGIKAPKSAAHRKPWVVYSDRAENAAYVNPGGKVKAAEVGLLDTFLVIRSQGEYLRLIKYNPANIKNNRMAQRKKAEYVGWMHRSRLILSPSSITDVQSGLHDKLLTAIGDTAAIMQPDAYFAAADSLKVFGEPELQKQTGTVGIHAIVYALKHSEDRRSVLVSKTPALSADKIGEQVIGWVPAVMLQEIGYQVFTGTAFSGVSALQKTLKYAPMIRPYHTDSACSFVSGTFEPVIDKRDNQVFNINGKGISYTRGNQIKQELKRINVLFAMEQSPRLPEQYPMLLNAIQNLGPFFAGSGDSFTYQFGAAVATRRGMETIPLTADYEMLTDRMVEMAPRVTDAESTPMPAWKAMRSTLELIGDAPEAVNLIISVGETGEMQENAPSSIVKALNEKNCRLLGWQLYASNEDKYNNYVLQLSNMIDHYADYRTKKKRNIILYADQFCRSNLLREAGPNFLMLDYPYASMTQGGFLFPEKGETLPMELFAGAVDSIVTQIRADHQLLRESIDLAFASVGNSKDRLDSLLVATYHLPKGMKPEREFKKMFNNATPLWYRETGRVNVADSLMSYYLLLSDPELKQTKERLETLCAMEVDVKDATKPKKGKVKQLCRYLKERMHPDDEVAFNNLPANQESCRDTVYVSTKKIRRHLYRFYMSELRSGRVCKIKRKEIKRYPLSFAHSQIFGVPANHPMLDGITVKELKKKDVLSDKELDELIQYFKERKENMTKKCSEEQITTEGQNYYYIASDLLP